LVTGLLAVVNGALLGNRRQWSRQRHGVVGAAGALVLGLIAMALGGLALVRSGRARLTG